MEKQNNFEYGQTDPDFIDQNTLVDGNQADEKYQQEFKPRSNSEFGESDPDIMEQNTLIDNDNYARDEDPYQYQEEFIEDLSQAVNDFKENETFRAENIPNEERIVNEDNLVTNDGNNSEFENDEDIDTETDYENDLEKDGDLDNDEELNDFDAEHYPENHPRE